MTTFGQSAGSFGVGYLMTSPLAQGLFHRAIGQSSADVGPAGTVAGMMLPKDAEASGVRLATALRVNTVEELRRLPASAIVSEDSSKWPADASGKIKNGSTAVLDGYVFPRDMYDTFAAGRQNDVPLLIGYNANEGEDILWEPLKAAAYQKSVKGQYAELAPKVLNLYPATTDEIAATSQLNLLRGNWFGWHMWTWGRLQATTGHHKVFFYDFAHVQQIPPDSDRSGVGAAHGFELAYVFDHGSQLPIKPSEADKRTIRAVSTYWTNFAKAGDPNGAGMPRWPSLSIRDQRAQRISDSLRDVPMPDIIGLELQDEYMTELRKTLHLKVQ